VSLRFGRLGLLVAGVLLSAALAGAQPVAIEHQDVACIVAGQFPVLDACFRPGPGLARARVYFRPEGVPNWYYVDASTPVPPNVGDPGDLVSQNIRAIDRRQPGPRVVAAPLRRVRVPEYGARGWYGCRRDSATTGIAAVSRS